MRQLDAAGSVSHNCRMPPALTDSWKLGALEVPNRVMLAPLAGIGNWFTRLQAKRYGAGMAVSEMVSSHAIHHRNARTCEEMLRIHPQERAGGPVSIQLFGADPEVMRSAAACAARSGADALDLNMGCPVPKVCKTGAGAALLDQPDLAVEIARAAAQGSGLPVTVKLRSGRRPGETSGLELAKRLVADAGVAAIALHPRSAAVHHKGRPDYELAAQLVSELDAPVILSGGLRERNQIISAFEQTGASAVMLARGALGNPWLFSGLLVPSHWRQRLSAHGRVALDDRGCGGASRRRAGHAVDAQGIPVVRVRLGLAAPAPRHCRRNCSARARSRRWMLCCMAASRARSPRASRCSPECPP